MRRPAREWFAGPVCIAFVAASISVTGCSTFSPVGLDRIVVQSKRDTARAQRLTAKAIDSIAVMHWDVAAEQLTAAVAADPSYGPAHNTLGLMHFNQGQLYQAVLAFEEASRWMPGNADTRFNLALALESAGRVEDAEVIYADIVALYPDNPHYLGNLVRLKVRRGETGPDVDAMLRDLALYETRPNWRRWADRMLGLELNAALDRGPSVPDFNSLDDADAAEQIPIEDKIIDLTALRDDDTPRDLVLPPRSMALPSLDIPEPIETDDAMGLSPPAVPRRVAPIRPR